MSANDIKWNYFPGYNKIILALLVEMKTRPFTKYSAKMKAACCRLLVNDKLLNIFVTIIFNKTNVNTVIDLLKTLEFLGMMFKAIDAKNKVIPSNFNIMFFYRGVKMIIESEFSLAVTKMLQILYDSYHLFSVDLQMDLSMFLLGKAFFRLFLHWCHNVRMVFFHLIKYCILPRANKTEFRGGRRPSIAEL